MLRPRRGPRLAPHAQLCVGLAVCGLFCLAFLYSTPSLLSNDPAGLVRRVGSPTALSKLPVSHAEVDSWSEWKVGLGEDASVQEPMQRDESEDEGEGEGWDGGSARDDFVQPALSKGFGQPLGDRVGQGNDRRARLRGTSQPQQTEPDDPRDEASETKGRPQGAGNGEPPARRELQAACAKILVNDFPPMQQYGSLLSLLPTVLNAERSNRCLGGHLFLFDRIIVEDMENKLAAVVREAGHGEETTLRRPVDWGAVDRGVFNALNYFLDRGGARQLIWEEARRRGVGVVAVTDARTLLADDRLRSAIRKFEVFHTLSIVLLPCEKEVYNDFGELQSVQSGDGDIFFRVNGSKPLQGLGARFIRLGFRHFFHRGCVTTHSELEVRSAYCKRVSTARQLSDTPATQQYARDYSPAERRAAVHIGSALLVALAHSHRHPASVRPDDPRLRVLAELRASDTYDNGEAPPRPEQLSPLRLQDIAAKAGLDVSKIVKPRRRKHNIGCARIIGNDVPPLHVRGQTYTNLIYVLKHQTPDSQCPETFILNRLLDDDIKQLVVRLLRSHGVRPSSIVARDIDWQLPVDSLDLLYIGDVNGARNMAIDLATRQGSGWVDLRDANTFTPDATWRSIVEIANSGLTGWLVAKPMKRLLKIQDPSWLNAQTTTITDPEVVDDQSQEPQLVVSTTSLIRFDQARAYGDRNKLALLLDKCGRGYFETNSQLSDHSPCAVAGAPVFRLFPFPAFASVEGETIRQQRSQLRNIGIELLTAQLRYLHALRHGRPTGGLSDVVGRLEEFAVDCNAKDGVLRAYKLAQAKAESAIGGST